MLGIFGFWTQKINGNKKIRAKSKSNAPLVGTEFSKLQERDDISLAPVYKELVEKEFGLKNSSGISFYCNANKNGEIYGEKAGKVVFYGTYNLKSGYAVRDFLDEDTMSAEPFVYYKNRKRQVLIWQLNNGYMALWIIRDKSILQIDNSINGKVAYFTDGIFGNIRNGKRQA